MLPSDAFNSNSEKSIKSTSIIYKQQFVVLHPFFKTGQVVLEVKSDAGQHLGRVGNRKALRIRRGW
jgi:hypothetical protein